LARVTAGRRPWGAAADLAVAASLPAALLIPLPLTLLALTLTLPLLALALAFALLTLPLSLALSLLALTLLALLTLPLLSLTLLALLPLPLLSLTLLALLSLPLLTRCPAVPLTRLSRLPHPLPQRFHAPYQIPGSLHGALLPALGRFTDLAGCLANALFHRLEVLADLILKLAGVLGRAAARDALRIGDPVAEPAVTNLACGALKATGRTGLLATGIPRHPLGIGLQLFHPGGQRILALVQPAQPLIPVGRGGTGEPLDILLDLLLPLAQLLGPALQVADALLDARRASILEALRGALQPLKRGLPLRITAARGPAHRIGGLLQLPGGVGQFR
jgi:hypothetical protein